MEFCEVVKRRKTIRDFANTTIILEKIHCMLEASLRATTHKHVQE